MSRALGGGGHGGFVGGGNRKSGQKGAGGGGGGEQTMELDPAIIYFTISNIRNTFSCGRTIESTLEQFRNKELTYKDLPLLLVLTDGVNYYSQNNRRLYLYKKLKSEGLLNTIEVRLKGIPATKRMNEKFSPEKCSLSAKLMREHHANKSHENQHSEQKHDASSVNDEQQANDNENNDNKEMENENEESHSDEGSDGEDVKEKVTTGQHNSKHKVDNVTKKDNQVRNKHEATTTANNKTKKGQKEEHEQQQQQQQQQKKKNKKKDKKKSHDKASDNDDDDEKNNGMTDIEKQLRELGIKTM